MAVHVADQCRVHGTIYGANCTCPVENRALRQVDCRPVLCAAASSPLCTDLGLMGKIAAILQHEPWSVRIALMQWKDNPRVVEIQVPTREDFNLACSAMDLAVGPPFGAWTVPLVSATGRFGGCSIYLYGRAL